MTIPPTMRAAVLTGHGGLDMLEVRSDVPVPAPGPDEVLIKVGACGMNNTDVNTRSGWYSKTVTDATIGGAFEEGGEDAPIIPVSDDPSLAIRRASPLLWSSPSRRRVRL